MEEYLLVGLVRTHGSALQESEFEVASCAVGELLGGIHLFCADCLGEDLGER